MELLFAFHYDKQIVCVNLYRVSVTFDDNYTAITETGVTENPSTWYLSDAGDIALLRAWLIRNALGGEIFVEQSE